MITDIFRNEGDYFRVRFMYESTLSFCEALGWFDRIMQDDRFFKALPLIKIKVDDVEEVVVIEHYKGDWIWNEVDGIMTRCGFSFSTKRLSEHTGRITSVWKIKWKKKK